MVVEDKCVHVPTLFFHRGVVTPAQIAHTFTQEIKSLDIGIYVCLVASGMNDG